MIDISKAFGTSSETISAFFQQPGVGYYIPLYQREYSWDEENVEQLMDDICHGVEGLLAKDESIRFMGTVILVKEHNPAVNIQPQDNRALPSMINNVIDGQQRISTIALLGCLLYQRLHQLRQLLPSDATYEGLREATDSYLATLQELFSVDIRRGDPQRKPIIIRGSVDSWTFNGTDEDNYKSYVSSFLATFIRATSKHTSFPSGSTSLLVGKNIRRMQVWLNYVEKAHEQIDDHFPLAWNILEQMSEEDLWSYSRPDLVKLVKNRGNPMSAVEKQVCSLVQLFAFCHYLLQRCCLTLIQPVSENWAFDMFQSLNATGTPLTALETFKPLVVNTVSSQGGTYKDSQSEAYYEHVDRLFSPMRSAASKSKLTNEYLTIFALTHDGSKLSGQFSEQRRWLTERYSKCNTLATREEFIKRMGDLAVYWSKAITFDPSKQVAISGTDGVVDLDRRQAALSMMYLQDAGHKMANAILSRFYGLVLRHVPDADKEFVLACKSVAAFFTIWRSALPNTGLDDVYRKLLRDHMSWEQSGKLLSAKLLNTHLQSALTDRSINTKSEWLSKASHYLRYDNGRTVCKFALFVTAHDTIADSAEPGLMKIGTSGSYPYLQPDKWRSDDLKSIEHVAPQDPKIGASWDANLYTDYSYQRIGNLVLLPTSINSSASNKGWLEKWIYYRHLAEKDPANIIMLQNEAVANGVDLQPETTTLLSNTPYQEHMTPIVQLGATGLWDRTLVDKRTQRICDILWDRIYPWLS